MAMKTRYNVVNGQVLSETRSGVKRDYLTDGLGNTLALLDNTQTKTDTFDYFPSGTVAVRTGTNPTPFQWVGGQGYFKDSGTRTHVRARNFHNNLGRWGSQDPIGFRGKDYNLYRYVNNRFVVAIDPSGLRCALLPIFGWKIWPCHKLYKHSTTWQLSVSPDGLYQNWKEIAKSEHIDPRVDPTACNAISYNCDHECDTTLDFHTQYSQTLTGIKPNVWEGRGEIDYRWSGSCPGSSIDWKSVIKDTIGAIPGVGDVLQIFVNFAQQATRTQVIGHSKEMADATVKALKWEKKDYRMWQITSDTHIEVQGYCCTRIEVDGKNVSLWEAFPVGF